MGALIFALISTVIISLVSLIGIFTLSLKDKVLKKILHILIGLAAGTLLGGALLHLLPEALELSESLTIFTYVIIGFACFFILERVLFWRHCHDTDCKVHMVTYLNIIGDSIHNFIDGLTIIASFLVSTDLGIATTFAVIMHEIPQEMGDFAILVYGGFSKLKALLYNLVSALAAILGAVVGFFLSSYITSLSVYLLPFAAGGFMYISASDLIPELHKEKDMKKSFTSISFFIIGLALMYAFKIF